GGGSSSSSSSGGGVVLSNPPSNNQPEVETLSTQTGEENTNTDEEITQGTKKSGITGAVTGLINGIKDKTILIIGIIFVLGIVILIVYRRKK
ncbi:MAG: hypothetical protein AABW50_00035, partial [Nanoarchaeota archaeon]